MFLRLLSAILFISFFTSCDFISPRDTTRQNEIALDTIINYNTVDVYPLFSACNNCDSNVKQNLCFENELVNLLKISLKENDLKVNNFKTDTIFVDILVDKLGVISMSKIYENPDLIHEIPEIDSILRQKINNLPKAIQPALKRGIPVDVKFKLPVVVSVKK